MRITKKIANEIEKLTEYGFRKVNLYDDFYDGRYYDGFIEDKRVEIWVSSLVKWRYYGVKVIEDVEWFEIMVEGITIKQSQESEKSEVAIESSSTDSVELEKNEVMAKEMLSTETTQLAGEVLETEVVENEKPTRRVKTKRDTEKKARKEEVKSAFDLYEESQMSFMLEVEEEALKLYAK